MSKQAAYPLPQETEELLGRVGSTGTAHALTLTVIEHPVTKVLSMTISNPRLEIKNGDKVTWNVITLPPAYRSGWEVVIQFNGSRFMDRFPGSSASVQGDILGEAGTFQDSKETYSVTLVKGMTSVAVTYPPSTTSDPTPYLVIDDIGNPTVPGHPCGNRSGRRGNWRNSK